MPRTRLQSTTTPQRLPIPLWLSSDPFASKFACYATWLHRRRIRVFDLHPCAELQNTNVRFGSLTDIGSFPSDVRFTSNSGHQKLPQITFGVVAPAQSCPRLGRMRTR